MSEEIIEHGEKERLIRGFGAMVLARTLDNKIMTAQRQGRVGFFTPTSGQEAAQIGLSMHLRKEDIIYQYYRDMPMMLHMGVPVDIIINQIYGNSSDIAKGRQMPSHLLARNYNFMSVPSPVATNLPLAVGTAYANRYLKKQGIVVASFGDGSSSTPDFHAAMNLAAVYNLPVIFFCENNGLAISLPTEKQTKVEIWKKAEAYGMPGILVNGSDMIDTYEKTREMVEYVREGKGPVLIEARCPRMGPHSTSDDPTKYLTDIVKEGSDRDPLVITQKRLIEMGIITEQVASKMREDSQNFITSRFDELEKVPPPSPETLFDDVYDEHTWIIDEERGDIIGRN